MKSLSPNLIVEEINTTVIFYQQLSFRTTASSPYEAPFIFAMMTC